jgi:mannose-6-phosphate isomerase-like protein (cupin superfamily)
MLLIPTLLPLELVENGSVQKTLIYKDATLEVALLVLSPGAKIKRHQHIDDEELYVIISTRECIWCRKGEWHSLTNESEHPMLVLSVKVRE